MTLDFGERLLLLFPSVLFLTSLAFRFLYDRTLRMEVTSLQRVLSRIIFTAPSANRQVARSQIPHLVQTSQQYFFGNFFIDAMVVALANGLLTLFQLHSTGPGVVGVLLSIPAAYGQVSTSLRARRFRIPMVVAISMIFVLELFLLSVYDTYLWNLTGFNNWST